MATAQLKSVAPGIQVRSGARGKSIRFFAMINGERFTKTFDELPIDMCLGKTGSATKELKAEYGKWVHQCSGKVSNQNGKHLRVPSIKELFSAYDDIAWKRNASPDHHLATRSVETAIKNRVYCLDVAGIRDSRPYTDLINVETMMEMYETFRAKGLSGITAKSYIASLQSHCARWTVLEYRKLGYDVQPQMMPNFGEKAKPKQYQELSPEMIKKIWDWYLNLENNASRDVVFYVTCMLELAISPEDIGQLTRDNFPAMLNGHHRLTYQRAKTRDRASNVRVDIEIADALYEKLHALVQERWDSGENLLPNWNHIERNLVNPSLRLACGLDVKKFPKASYELRKLCIHTILVTPVEQGGGIDQAVKISGDRRSTIEKYYCDPYKSHTALPHRPLEAFVERMQASAG